MFCLKRSFGKKRNGEALSTQEIRILHSGHTNNTIGEGRSRRSPWRSTSRTTTGRAGLF